jgi:hypothetical protein
MKESVRVPIRYALFFAGVSLSGSAVTEAVTAAESSSASVVFAAVRTESATAASAQTAAAVFAAVRTEAATAASAQTAAAVFAAVRTEAATAAESCTGTGLVVTHDVAISEPVSAGDSSTADVVLFVPPSSPGGTIVSTPSRDISALRRTSDVAITESIFARSIESGELVRGIMNTDDGRVALLLVLLLAQEEDQ